mmetsp:Transcript_10255/g.33853  ORF Transcript_10255/g.33853 Transcript_10255/m.33853 type:complete len:244 (+) Transcript_10255:9482-10213(+)
MRLRLASYNGRSEPAESSMKRSLMASAPILTCTAPQASLTCDPSSSPSASAMSAAAETARALRCHDGAVRSGNCVFSSSASNGASPLTFSPESSLRVSLEESSALLSFSLSLDSSQPPCMPPSLVTKPERGCCIARSKGASSPSPAFAGAITSSSVKTGRTCAAKLARNTPSEYVREMRTTAKSTCRCGGASASAEPACSANALQMSLCGAASRWRRSRRRTISMSSKMSRCELEPIAAAAGK